MSQSEHLSETIEDYLQLIYTMRREGAPVIAARVKERKGVSAPTAWATLKRMERDGLVTLDADHHIELSPQGQDRAESIIRRHMLAERLLTDILKLDWADVHDEAHRVEHAISPLIERQILAILDNPETCPHGNPIPGLASDEPSKAYALREAREGAALVVNNIAEHAEDDAALMHYLERNQRFDVPRSLELYQNIYGYRGLEGRAIWPDRSTDNIPSQFYILALQMAEAIRRTGGSEDLIAQFERDAIEFRISASGGAVLLAD
jgi:DtxR family Mn-dependent transcriptional regulator